MARKPTITTSAPVSMRAARSSRRSSEMSSTRHSAGADPGAAAGVGPDFSGDPILFGLRRALRLALAAVQLPGGGQDLVCASGAARGVECAVVAAGLAHHDVGG